MAIQLPEPDFYTLAEVAKRWEVSEDMLLRLGVEKKITIGAGVIPPVNLIDITTLCFDEEPKASFLPGGWSVIVDGDMQEVDKSEPIPKKMYMEILNAAGLLYIVEYTKAKIKEPEKLRLDPRRTCDDLVIPAKEIHRIERQHENAEKAIAKAETESPIPSQAKRALNTRAKVIGALLRSHNIKLNDRGAVSDVMVKLELQGVTLDRDTVKTILDEAKNQI